MAVKAPTKTIGSGKFIPKSIHVWYQRPHARNAFTPDTASCTALGYCKLVNTRFRDPKPPKASNMPWHSPSPTSPPQALVYHPAQPGGVLWKMLLPTCHKRPCWPGLPLTTTSERNPTSHSSNPLSAAANPENPTNLPKGLELLT